MEIRVCSIKEANLRLNKLNLNNIKAIIISSYNADIDKILPEK